jgi:hypothetical protein
MTERMRRLTGLAMILALGTARAQAPATAAAPPAVTLPADVMQTVERLRTSGLADRNGYAILEDLVTRVGPRPAGTPAEARAREWAAGMLRQQGFANVRIEPFTTTSWQASRETAQIIAPFAQPLVIAALGASPSTPDGGITGEVVRFTSLDALRAAPPAAVRDRIVFIDEAMVRAQDGSGYGAATVKRRGCGLAARSLGARACLIRSAGTNDDRFAHQGWGGTAPPETQVPNAALAPPDADTLGRALARGAGPVQVRIDIQTQYSTTAPSGNVLAEVSGRENPQQIVLAAAHLDSWSLGQGALDDGAGVAIITAAARLVNDLPRKPRRSIRVLLAGSEEPVNSDTGGNAYRDAHRNEMHVVAAESDVGDGRVWRLRSRAGEAAVPQLRLLQQALAPLGVLPGDNGPTVGGGSDIGPLVATGVPLLALNQDASRYFDVHHTANDTLERVRLADLQQNIAAWAVTLYLMAEMDWDLRQTDRR